MKTKLLLITLWLAHTVFSQIPTNGLVARYDFDNFSFSDAIHGDNFLKRGVDAGNSTGILGNAYRAISLNGDELFRSDIVFENNGFPINQQKTISFWIKTSTNDMNERIIYNDTDKMNITETDFNGTYVFLKDGKINATKGVRNISEITHIHSTIVSDNNWHHIAIQTYSTDNSTDGNYRHIAYIYVDGVKEGGTVVVGSHVNYAFTRGIHIGDINIATIENGTVPNVNKYQEVLDQLLIYDRLLTDTEVNNLSSQRASLSIADDVFNYKVTVSPNPVNNILKINLPTEKKLLKVTVFNLIGEKVIVSNNQTIDFSTITHGVYVLKVESTDGKVAVKKIIKE